MAVPIVPNVTTLFGDDRLALLAVSSVVGAWAKCGCGHKKRVEVIVALDGSKYHDHPVRRTYDSPYEDALVAIKWTAPLSCLNCRKSMYIGRVIRGHVTERPCSDDCTHATGDECRCKCGGSNHGIEA